MRTGVGAFQKNFIIFCVGALGYGGMEIAFRGYTHWTMLLTGGVVFSLLYRIQIHMGDRPLWMRCAIGTAVITAAEFAVGCVVNLWLGWNVWDYSAFRIHLLGQICLVFSAIWFLLCGPVFYTAQRMEQNWNRNHRQKRY